MNERIVKLITEADAYAWTQCDKYAPECGEVNYLWEDAFRKKFAELIVRECTNIVLHYTDVDEGVAVAKKHFGVEE